MKLEHLLVDLVAIRDSAKSPATRTAFLIAGVGPPADDAAAAHAEQRRAGTCSLVARFSPERAAREKAPARRTGPREGRSESLRHQLGERLGGLHDDV
jgi:hypothetical protein